MFDIMHIIPMRIFHKKQGDAHYGPGSDATGVEIILPLIP